MNLKSIVTRVLFFAAWLLFVLAVVEKLANTSGYTVIGVAYAPGRLLEFAAIMVLFVMASLLREIREALQHGR